MALSVGTVVLVGLLVTGLFLGAVFHIAVVRVAIALFVIAMLALVAAMLVFMRELVLALGALDADVTAAIRSRAGNGAALLPRMPVFGVVYIPDQPPHTSTGRG